jgi:hypothetical protein
MALVAAKVAIRGTRPLLWHRFGMDAIPLEKKPKQGVAGMAKHRSQDNTAATLS